MAAVEDFDEVIEQCQRALREFPKGNPQPMQMMFSHRDDATLANPFGGIAHGGEEVAERLVRAASQIRDGEFVDFETVEKYVTPELAYVVWIERVKAKVGGREDITPFALRVTMIFRPEEGTWRVVHRHADPLTTPQPAESLLQAQQ
jgi:ketosteroid isomerase-like protein